MTFKYAQHYIVRGTGSFPTDMLRREHAWPADTESAVRIGTCPTDGELYFQIPRTIELTRYVASKGGVTVKGLNTNPPLPFRVNMLCYNRDAGGGYGSIQFQSATYLFGSLIAWQVGAAGGSIIEKQAPETAPEDPLMYEVLDWRELP